MLTKILQFKIEEVAQQKKQWSLERLQDQILAIDVPRDFIGALQDKINLGFPAVIAEIKKASPSRGIIRPNFEPAEIAKSYWQFGAACLSVLTDTQFFSGSFQDLHTAHVSCPLPILRKDFMIDAYQIYQARAIGADCVLLIVAALTDSQLQEYTAIAHALGMAVLLEVHDASELQRALLIDSPLLGINNRNLKTFEVSLDTTLSLLADIPNNKIVITESGILTSADVEKMKKHEVCAFLVGESLMRETNPGEKLQELFGKIPVSSELSIK